MIIKLIYLTALSALWNILQIQFVGAIHLDSKTIQAIDKDKMQLLLSFKKIIEEKTNSTFDYFEPVLYKLQKDSETIYDILYNVVIVQGILKSNYLQLQTQVAFPSKYLGTPYVKSFKIYDMKKLKEDSKNNKTE